MRRRGEAATASAARAGLGPLGKLRGGPSRRHRGAELPPDDETAWVARAFSRAAADPAAALEDVNRALQLNEYYFPAWESKVHLLAERLDRPDEALAVLDRGNCRFSGSRVACRRAGVLRARQSKAEAARADAQAALELDPAPAVQYQAACVTRLLARQNAAEAPRAAGTARRGPSRRLRR